MRSASLEAVEGPQGGRRVGGVRTAARGQCQSARPRPLGAGNQGPRGALAESAPRPWSRGGSLTAACLHDYVLWGTLGIKTVQLKSNQNATDSGKALHLPLNCLEESRWNLDGGPGPGSRHCDVNWVWRTERKRAGPVGSRSSLHPIAPERPQKHVFTKCCPCFISLRVASPPSEIPEPYPTA